MTIRLVIIVAMLAAIVGGLYAVHRPGYNSGKESLQAEWDKEKADAQSVQDTQTDIADADLTKEVEVIRTVYRDRVKEVTRYVPTGTCPADADFVSLFNASR